MVVSTLRISLERFCVKHCRCRRGRDATGRRSACELKDNHAAVTSEQYFCPSPLGYAMHG